MVCFVNTRFPLTCHLSRLCQHFELVAKLKNKYNFSFLQQYYLSFGVDHFVESIKFRFVLGCALWILLT